MPQSPITTDVRQRFGLRIERDLLQLAIATPTEGPSHRITIEAIHCPRPDGWLSPAAQDDLVDCLVKWRHKHQMDQGITVASLDGDYCVTRITTGHPQDVDSELNTLGTRIPRYLQLGPGEKVIGSFRERLAASVDYAVTGVASRGVIETVYEAFRAADLNILWLEPSLNSLARLAGHLGHCNAAPTLIADGTGRQWDVGIAFEGRLLLDYRPAAANNEQGFHDAVINHLERLRRFCQRHRQLSDGNLSELLICGSPEKAKAAADLFDDSHDIDAAVLNVSGGEFILEQSEHESGTTAVVATVLPLLIGIQNDGVPDLLDHVRRAPDVSTTTQVLRIAWPALVAAVLLLGSFAMVHRQRGLADRAIQRREAMQAEVYRTKARMMTLAQRRQLVDHFGRIEKGAAEPRWNLTLRQITQSLLDRCKLNSFHVEDGHQILLDGTVTDESLVYEQVSQFRRLPEVEQVALKATNPEPQTRGIRFLIGLHLHKETLPVVDSTSED
ncbi:hypothetical protein [Crateriforma spongiae]|uniref:hypothetical protein n=1 Tax=Crateriforma spongiae TaxID=2724528 RepID=UPI0014483C63|nr:hypothetical protein [Crateriforma spongiae]